MTEVNRETTTQANPEQDFGNLLRNLDGNFATMSQLLYGLSLTASKGVAVEWLFGASARRVAKIYELQGIMGGDIPYSDLAREKWDSLHTRASTLGIGVKKFEDYLFKKVPNA